MPKKPTKASTKLMVYDPKQRTWIYEAVHPVTKKAFYVGRTIDVLRRGAEHDRDSSACRLLRVFLNLNNFKFRDCVRIVPELPNGVPASRAAEFEAFFILQRDTIYHPERRPDGCNLRHGDHVASLDYQAIKAEIAEGFKWDDVPADVIEARGREAMFEACVEEVGDAEPELSEALSLAIIERKRVERLHMSVVLLAETLAEEYEGISPYQEIDRSQFTTNVNALRDRVNAEAVPDDKMLSLVKSIAFFGKPEGAEWEMRANVAVHLLRALAKSLETREEAKMPDTLAIRNMKLVRTWTVENGGKKPSVDALRKKKSVGTAEEATMGFFLRNWKAFRDKGAYKQANKVECDFLMRHVDWWETFVNGSKTEKGADLTSKVNSMLKQGYGHKDEPEFEGKKQWPAGSHGTETNKVYKKMANMAFGMFADLSPMLDGVDPNRARWYIERSASNRPKYLKRQAEFSAVAKARGHANGVKPLKKRKRSDASSSTDALDEEKEENEEEENEGSDSSDEDSEEEEEGEEHA